MQRTIQFLAIGWLLFGSAGLPGQSQSKFGDFNKLTEGAKIHEGLFTLYHKEKENRVYLEIKPNQFKKPLLCPIAVARGLGMGGHTLNFGEQWVLVFDRVGDNVHVIRRNVHFRAKKGTPADTAVETTYTDSVLKSLPIKTINPKRAGVLIDLNGLFMADFADLDIGSFDASRSTWHKVKAFKNNVELEVAATFTSRRYGDDSVIDPRGTTVVLHYGLVDLPSGYQPRLADDRVGHFLSVVKDFTTDNKETPFLRYINRWRLERAYSDGKLSPPKKKIVFWIEKSVPIQYRKYVRDGILEWNKAFERIGFLDAIEVRQQEGEEFEPEDINYATFRWITNDRGYAMGPSRANPMTGEILDADIVFDADMVRYMKHSYRLFLNGQGKIEEPASLIQATRKGWTLPQRPFFPRASLLWQQPKPEDTNSGTLGWNEPQRRFWAIQRGLCQCGAQRRLELGMAAVALAVRNEGKNIDEAIEEVIGQAIKETTMHEVGHTLGLRHNFKASTMLRFSDLHKIDITRKKGLTGSVMDYNPVNIAPKGVKQGDYFTTTLGPYDYLAIEYAYKPLSGGTEGEYAELKKIAAKASLPDHDYGTDEDLYGTPDPLINVWDLGNDPMEFAKHRIALADELFEKLADKVVQDGEGYQRVRQSFSLLLGQYGNAAHLVSNFVGGQYINRDHHGDKGGQDPIVPVETKKQREALKFLEEHILTDKPFQFSPQLLRRLAADRWMHWGNEHALFSSASFRLHSRILSIQRIVLDHLFDPSVLQRIQDNSLQYNNGDQPLTIAEVFRGVTEAVWADVPPGEGKPKSSIIRRNLQREHIKSLSALLLGERSAPPDARSLARLHLREIQGQIAKALKMKQGLDDTSRAHLQETHDRIAKILDASVQVREP
ncbi:MAG: hypothetical protein KatS3mg105_3266 [Gemmatales bacterium]|nr:MAG: hypothetical protein KatS3mg105_3266 [Gemmatales bacterium]